MSMKKLLAFALLLVMVCGCIPAQAESAPEYKNVKMTVNGQRIILLDANDEQQKSIVVDGTVYVPLEYFINAIGGQMTYDEATNQMTITLPSATDSASGGTADQGTGAYSDADIASILTSGRWSRTTEQGTSFFDFSEDNTGMITGMLPCIWSVSNGVVNVDFTSQGKDWHRSFVFTVSGSTAQLVEGDQVFVLNGSDDILVNLIGEWHAAGDDAVKLILSADGAFRIEVSGLVYTGTWSLNASTVYLTQKGITIQGSFNGTSIGLDIGASHFTFVR